MTKVIDTLPDYFFHLQHNRCVTEGTLLTYKATLKNFCELFGMKDTAELLPTHIHQFKGTLKNRTRRFRYGISKSQDKLTDGFIYSTMIRLKAYIKWLSERGYLEGLQVSDIPLNKMILNQPVYLTKPEMKKVTHALNERVRITSLWKGREDYKLPAYMARALVRMLYTTGLRNAEIRELKMKDLDLERMTGTIIGKGNKHGFFTFNTKCRRMLKIYLKKRAKLYPDRDHPYVFSSWNMNWRKPLTAAGVNTLLKEVGEYAQIGKRLHAHVFRHTCATHLLDEGANIREVQEKLRHTNLDTTALYTHISNNRLSEITRGLKV